LQWQITLFWLYFTIKTALAMAPMVISMAPLQISNCHCNGEATVKPMVMQWCCNGDDF
jgi:hypothetical protein